MSAISVTILVKNGERSLKSTLDALTSFDEVLLCDTGSEDATLAIGAKYQNVVIHQLEFAGFGKTHNVASSLAKHDWILSIDSDEVVSKELLDEIQNLELNPDTIYFLPRINYFNGKKINCCGWQKEKCPRLFHRKTTQFSETLVHESIELKNCKKHFLVNPVLHTPYATISDFLKKMEHYSTLFAQEKKGKKRSSPFIAILHGLWAFWKSYLLKKGFLGGYEGFLISLYNGHTSYYKYLKLYHLNDSNYPV